MNNISVEELKSKAREIRISIIKMLTEAGSGHTAGALGMADIFTSLYFSILESGDRLVLSNGHIVPVRYAAMAESGLLPKEELMTLRKLGSRLQGHPDRRFIKELVTTSGPLGCGLAQACGMTLSNRLDKKDSKIYVVVSDGEQDEGNNWEAVMFASKYKLSNLICIMDRNNIQIDGTTDNVMPLNPLKEKYLAFNWNVLEIDGHDFNQILESIRKAKTETQKPTMIIAKTIPGKGVSFMENDYKWHGKAPNREEAERALNELK